MMKIKIALVCVVVAAAAMCGSLTNAQSPAPEVNGSLPRNDFEGEFSRPLGQVLDEVAERFQVKLRYKDIDTTGLVVKYADFRIRPYSVEETLTNILAPFDFDYEKQKDNAFKLKKYEYYRRATPDGEKLLAYLSSLYDDRASWEARRDSLIPEVRRRLGLDDMLARYAVAKPVYGKIKKHEGFTTQDFSLETVDGQHVCGTVFKGEVKKIKNKNIETLEGNDQLGSLAKIPSREGRMPVIMCPNGHFANGRFNPDLIERYETLARMGAIVVSYDLHGYGASESEVGVEAHRTPEAHTRQIANGIKILDFMLEREDVDPTRVGVNGGSGGGTQAIMLAALDPRYTVCCPTVSLASHFDGGCPCESGMGVTLAGGGSCNVEIAAAFAPRPMMLVGDGGDWTRDQPVLEVPFLKRIYGFYGAEDNIQNKYLPDERHDFGPNKRQAVYDFFEKVWGAGA